MDNNGNDQRGPKLSANISSWIIAYALTNFLYHIFPVGGSL